MPPETEVETLPSEEVVHVGSVPVVVMVNAGGLISTTTSVAVQPNASVAITL